ncbi:hypothetical protein Hanom_Chr09g00856451 [Helianthus anomalus]
MQYELQEIYGIGNLVGNNPGKECLLCLSEPRDTTLLCRHVVRPPVVERFFLEKNQKKKRQKTPIPHYIRAFLSIVFEKNYIRVFQKTLKIA